MSEFKYGQYSNKNPFSFLGEISTTKLTSIIDNIKEVMESPEISRLAVIKSLTMGALNGNPAAAAMVYFNMFPRKRRGIKIDYRRKFYEKCPTHHTTTYGTSDPFLVWCPFCMDFLVLENPFY